MPLAIKTIEAINQALERDQGGLWRQTMAETIPDCSDAFEGEQPPFRNHLGASMIGRECAREIWYGFRWVTLRRDEGRMVRLFNRGHLEEGRLVAMLKAAGIVVHNKDARGKQYRISKGHKGHSGGSMDGVLEKVPDLPPGTFCLGEFKTHNDKSFQKLKEEGVLKAKWEHFVQMQTYMGDQRLPAALYLAINKNDDELYGEIVMFDANQYQRFQQRTVMIIEAKEAPPKIKNDPTFFKCRFCDHKDVCYERVPPYPTCRSCAHVELRDSGSWFCNYKGVGLTSGEQLTGCTAYKLNPGVNAKP